MNNPEFRINNFDLIRLFAATQVVLIHIVHIMNLESGVLFSGLLRFITLFPGVPIFFFISGFLISKSFENNNRLVEYAQNRFLRLYPALIACVTLSFIFIYVSGYMNLVQQDMISWVKLFLAKASFLQFYNPDFMRGYGDGVVNGSLWTITVELQFYLLVPIIYWLMGHRKERVTNLKLFYLLMIFFLINRIFTYIPDVLKEEVWYKLFRVSFLPWFYMFLVGVIFQRNFKKILVVMKGKAGLLFFLYLVAGYFVIKFNLSLGNNVNPILFVVLSLLIMAAAYSFPGSAKKILKRNDLSYGVYIYHMPIINYLIYKGFESNGYAALVAFFGTFLVAFLSWKLIESKSLALKKHPLNPIKSTK